MHNDSKPDCLSSKAVMAFVEEWLRLSEEAAKICQTNHLTHPNTPFIKHTAPMEVMAMNTLQDPETLLGLAATKPAQGGYLEL